MMKKLLKEGRELRDDLHTEGRPKSADKLDRILRALEDAWKLNEQWSADYAKSEKAAEAAYLKGWNDAMGGLNCGSGKTSTTEPRPRVVTVPHTSPTPHETWRAYCPERRDLGSFYASTEKDAADCALMALSQEGEG